MSTTASVAAAILSAAFLLSATVAQAGEADKSKKGDAKPKQVESQFEIQVGTSDLQNAETVRSQAEKRLEQQRKDLTRNWGG